MVLIQYFPPFLLCLSHSARSREKKWKENTGGTTKHSHQCKEGCPPWAGEKLVPKGSF